MTVLEKVKWILDKGYGIYLDKPAPKQFLGQLWDEGECVSEMTTNHHTPEQVIGQLYRDAQHLRYSDDPLTRDDVTWEELGRGFIEVEPNWEEGGA